MGRKVVSGAREDQVNPRISGALQGDFMRPKHPGEPFGIGWARGPTGSCSPVSCRKSTSVIPQVNTVCPLRTRTPGLSSAQGAIASAPGPAPPGRRVQHSGASKGEPVGTRGLVELGWAGPCLVKEAAYWVATEAA